MREICIAYKIHQNIWKEDSLSNLCKGGRAIFKGTAS